MIASGLAAAPVERAADLQPPPSSPSTSDSAGDRSREGPSPGRPTTSPPDADAGRLRRVPLRHTWGGRRLLLVGVLLLATLVRSDLGRPPPAALSPTRA